MPTFYRTDELRLGDTVKLFDGPWGYGVVYQIKDGLVMVQRVYECTSDFAYSAGVIPYIGTEICTFDMRSTRVFEVWRRKELR